MSVILEFLQSDLGKMLIAAILGFVFGGKNPAWVNWILELLKLQKKAPPVVEYDEYADEEVEEDVISEELGSAIKLAEHFGKNKDLKNYQAARDCIVAIIDADLGVNTKEWKTRVEVPSSHAQLAT